MPTGLCAQAANGLVSLNFFFEVALLVCVQTYLHNPRPVVCPERRVRRKAATCPSTLLLLPGDLVACAGGAAFIPYWQYSRCWPSSRPFDFHPSRATEASSNLLTWSLAFPSDEYAGTCRVTQPSLAFASPVALHRGSCGLQTSHALLQTASLLRHSLHALTLRVHAFARWCPSGTVSRAEAYRHLHLVSLAVPVIRWRLGLALVRDLELRQHPPRARPPRLSKILDDDESAMCFLTLFASLSPASRSKARIFATRVERGHREPLYDHSVRGVCGTGLQSMEAGW
jgi:hypothetical protein